jgi:hypothetical protein
MTDETDSGLSPIQKRCQELTEKIGLDLAEALHALGRRRGPWPNHKVLTRREQIIKVQDYIRRGLTEIEAHRVVGLPFHFPEKPPSPKRSVASRRTASSDWTPSQKAYNQPTPGRRKKGLLK